MLETGLIYYYYVYSSQFDFSLTPPLETKI